MMAQFTHDVIIDAAHISASALGMSRRLRVCPNHGMIESIVFADRLEPGRYQTVRFWSGDIAKPTLCLCPVSEAELS